eukprot:5976738-Amphidinium_carterae.3
MWAIVLTRPLGRTVSCDCALYQGSKQCHIVRMSQPLACLRLGPIVNTVQCQDIVNVRIVNALSIVD